jgi:hypothetical protein
MEVLYKWAEKGSLLFIIDSDSENMSDDFQAFFNIYINMGQYVGIRPKKLFLELIKTWEIVEPGFLPLEKWVDMSPNVRNELIESWGGGGPFGGFLKK